MKFPIVLSFAAACLIGCAADQQAQVAKTAVDLANAAASGYAAYAAAQSGTLTPAQAGAALTAATTEASDLYGIAALGQAYVGSGKTPVQANLATGAANPAPAATVVAKMPAQPITQDQVNQIYAAAAILAKKTTPAQPTSSTQIKTPFAPIATRRIGFKDLYVDGRWEVPFSEAHPELR